jgi:hypothetical protein
MSRPGSGRSHDVAGRVERLHGRDREAGNLARCLDFGLVIESLKASAARLRRYMDSLRFSASPIDVQVERARVLAEP